jgi:Holliday junction DNA helicase RuvA
VADHAEQIIATLRRKVTRFALAPSVAEPSADGEARPVTVVDGNVIEDAYQALMALGHSPTEARGRLDRALAGGKSFKSAEDILNEIYKHGT